MKGLERKLLLGGLVLLAGCLLVLFACQENQQSAAPFYVDVSANEKSEQIMPWEDENGDYYVFLPAYAALSKVQMKLNTTRPVFFAGEKLTDGLSCEAFELDREYMLEVAGFRENESRKVTFVRSANVAAMYVDTASGSMNYIHAEKGNEEQGKIRLYTVDGELDYGGEVEAIKGRGNATWLYPEKKPYSLNLQEEVDLLNLGKAQKWILLANAYDPSNMRNKIVFDFAKEVGLLYSPDSQWVDLYLNGEYTGLYLLCERNEVQEERVNISPETGYLVSMELEERLAAQNYPYALTKEKQALRIHYAPARDNAGETVLRVFQSVENALLAEDGIDPDTGKHWTELIDLDSWVRKYLIEEIFASNDGGYISQYFYFSDAEANEKVYAGPVWDYDISLGNATGWQFTNPQAFYASRLFAGEAQQTPWFHMLCKKDEFCVRLTEIYSEEFLPAIEQLIEKGIILYTEAIKRAVAMNCKRWNEGAELDSEHRDMENFLNQRVAFLSSVWLEGKSYFQVCANAGSSYHYAYYAVTPGECLMELPVLPDTEYQTFLGWYYADTDEPFDSSVPITQDTEIYAKWADSQQKKAGQVIKLMPLAIIACLGVGILWADIRRMRKGG